MANINITIRIDKELKKEADNLFHELGMSFTTAVTIFAKQAIREQRIPFVVTLHQDRAVAATSMEVEKISNKYLDENKKSLPRTCKMKYLTKEQAIYLHKQFIQESCGMERIRNEGLLKSAIASSFQTFSLKEFYPTIEEKAACLGYGLVSNHCFIDGNKRIGAHAMLVFLALNDIQLDFIQEELI